MALDFLARACAEAAERVREAERLVGARELRARALAQPAPPPLTDALTASAGVALIAEVKRASPSRGHLAWIPDPAAHALAYTEGGAAAVSVLTEPAHFHGTLGDLAAVSAAVRVPVLRKDFVVDAYQLWEARAAGASAVLLIVAALDDEAVAGLTALAWDAGLDVLVEVHDRDEALRTGDALANAAERAAQPRAGVVGVNARDLATLALDPDRFAACIDALPDDAIAVAESGIATPEDVARAADAGADAVLVGEHLATAVDPAAAVRSLVAAAGVPTRRRQGTR